MAGFFAALGFLSNVAAGLAEDGRGTPLKTPSQEPWKDTFFSDPRFFPIAVWLQDPKNAAKYKEAGINVFVGLWDGPTEKQLAGLKAAGMRAICAQNEVGLKHKNDPTIIGWMHGDEPDNAQSLGEGKGYGPPVPSSQIIGDYRKIRAADPSRPVLLNLGQGVAWDNWYGRGVRTNHPEDYPEYIKGGDIVSFDIYPANHDSAEVKGKLWLVAHGVDRLRKWSNDEKTVWNCIECTPIENPRAAPSPKQVKAEVWMSLIHGSRGIIYFVHQFKPSFVEAGLLAGPEMLRAVTAINRQIQELAPVLNSPTVHDVVSVKSQPPEVPIDVLVKRHDNAIYLFAAEMRGAPARGIFQLAGTKGKQRVKVLGENKTMEAADGKFEDLFDPYEVHLYKIWQDGTSTQEKQDEKTNREVQQLQTNGRHHN